ncbi:MAG: ATP-grasp domain-containing protein [Gemmatimonadetes bacterium]|nr:MAG: ATP-grasp domain-containing protein [Gemmatimonadota bacterium]
MRHVVFYSPHFGENTLRFVWPIRRHMPDVNLIGIGQDPPEYIESLGGAFNEFYRVEDATQQDQLEAVIRALSTDRQIHALLNIQEQLQMLIARVRERFGIPGIYPETMHKFRDKAHMKRVLKENNIRCADYRRVNSEAEARQFAEENGYPFVLKPLKGAGSVDTFVVFNQLEFDNYLRQMDITPETPAIMEEFILGQEGSFDTLTLNGEIKYYGINHYYPTPLDAMRNPWIQPIYIFNHELVDSPELEDVREVGRRVIEVFAPGTSITHMEWFRRQSDGKIYVGEIAARPGGKPIIDLHNFAQDIDLYRAWGELMINHRVDLNAERKYSAGCAHLRAQGPKGGRIREIHGVEQVRQAVGRYIVDELIPPIGSEKTESYIGEGHYYCRGKRFDEVFSALRYIVETIRIYC